MTKQDDKVIKTVKMDDDKIVEFAGKRKMLKQSIISEDGKVSVRLDFVNGEVRFLTVPDALLTKFAAHGAEQKLGDEIAGLDAVEDCILAIDELLDRLHKGEWSQKREGNGMAGTSVLVQALAEHSKKTVDKIKEFLAGKTQAEKVALRNNPAIKPIVERIEAEKLAKKKGGAPAVDTDALLEQLG